MIDLTLPLIGPALIALHHHRALARKLPQLALLDHGTPGSGKTHAQDLVALELVDGAKAAIEHVNGQSLTVDLVRHWRTNSCYGNLFARWTVKRVDELDLASPAARNELLSLLDYLPKGHAILATTNNYASLRADNNRRIESRFKVLEVNGPKREDAIAYLAQHFQTPTQIAEAIIEGSLPDGEFYLPEIGVNMRLCIENAVNWQAGQEALAAAA